MEQKKSKSKVPCEKAICFAKYNWANFDRSQLKGFYVLPIFDECENVKKAYRKISYFALCNNKENFSIGMFQIFQAKLQKEISLEELRELGWSGVENLSVESCFLFKIKKVVCENPKDFIEKKLSGILQLVCLNDFWNEVECKEIKQKLKKESSSYFLPKTSVLCTNETRQMVFTNFEWMNHKEFSTEELEKCKFKFIDLFAGIGGIRRPFQKLGGKCVFSSEIDKFAVQTYEANWFETPHGDITKINETEIPKFDILLAGFPCQAFSIAGKRKGFEDARGTMFFEVARILKYHQPKSFLLENVKGLINHDKGKTFRMICEILEKDLGYKIFYKVLNAKNFGVPQNRERIIIVGFKEKNIKFEFPKEFNVKVCVGDILFAENAVEGKYTISDRLWTSMQRRKEIQRAKGNGFGYSLFNENSPYASTLSARYYKDGSEILIEQKGKNPRRLTPRECARLQGFEDDFKIVCSDIQAYKQFGNSVPTKMIEAVAVEMIKALKGNL